MHKSWLDTNLWRFIEERDPSGMECGNYLKMFLPQIETLLSLSSTSPLDFTLHDDQHSFRVAQRMTDLIDKETTSKFSNCELALLLSCAYLHDIGMNPKRQIVQDINSFFLEPETSKLGEDEKGLVQRWLDSYDPGIHPPIMLGSSISDRLMKANDYTTYYCRFRHNDWSEDYIREVLEPLPSPPFPTWIPELILLCKSHHYGIEKLEKDEFNLRLIGSEKGVVNLRYLAALLRVADVLEIDPERTPPVLLEQRNVDKKSVVYWHKDQSMAPMLNADRRDIIVSARTKDAWTHKAVISTLDGIDAELSLCGSLQREGFFTRGMHIENLSYYKWIWPSKVSRDIRPISNSFEYINGAFRPDSHRILALLSGTRLYGDKLASLRELVQNAADAVREQIAHDIVAEDNTFGLITPEERGRRHSIQIEIVRDGKILVLKCSDTGTGMTKEVIENHLLVSGSKPRPELLELQRQCEKKGTYFVRSGEFGIGVLSYFMIASSVTIQTKPSEEVYLSDRQAWKFELDGMGSFGELRPIAKKNRGTEVSLRLIEDLSDAESEEKIFEYLTNVFVRTPCNLLIQCGARRFSRSTGWTRTEEQILSSLTSQKDKIDNSPREDFTSHSKMKEQEKKSKRENFLASEIKSLIRLTTGDEYDILNCGKMRVHIPYFELEEGPSLEFADIRSNILSVDTDGSEFHEPFRSLSFAWRGFLLQSARAHLRSQGGPAFVCGVGDLDFDTGGQISVDRRSLELSRQSEIDKSVSYNIASSLNKFFEMHPDSPYSVFSPQWTRWRRQNKLAPIARWVTHADDGGKIIRKFAKIDFPAAVQLSVFTESSEFLNGEQKGKFSIRHHLIRTGFSSRGRTPLIFVKPTKLLIRLKPFVTPFLLYENADFWIDDLRNPVIMPSNWNNLLCVDVGLKVLNANHTIVKMVDSQSYNSYVSSVSNKTTKELLLTASMNDTEAACFITAHVQRDQEYWMSIMDHFPTEWQEICRRVKLDDIPILIWNNPHRLVCLSITKSNVQSFRIGIQEWDTSWEHLPHPHPDWVL